MTLETPQPPATARSARKRQRILDAAGQCFAAKGFAKTRMEEIAQRAGVSKALVYQHFRGKEKVLEAVLAHTLDSWAEASREKDLVGAGSVLEAIATMHRSVLSWARETPVLLALFQLDPMVVMGLGHGAVHRAMNQFRTNLVAAVEQGVRSGELREDLDVERVADVIRILHLAFIEQLLEPEWVLASDDRLIEASLDVLFHGIARAQP